MSDSETAKPASMRRGVSVICFTYPFCNRISAESGSGCRRQCQKRVYQRHLIHRFNLHVSVFIVEMVKPFCREVHSYYHRLFGLPGFSLVLNNETFLAQLV